MHEHDLDLIAALADGSLTDDTEARALVDRCGVCAAEYRSQRAVLELLAASPAPAMTDLERVTLRRQVRSQMQSPAPATSPWWYRWSYAAAGLFVLIGLVAVLNGQIWPGGEDAATVAEEAAGGSDAPTDESAAPLFDAQGDGGGAERVTTTAAAAEALDYPFQDLADEARANRDTTDSAVLGLSREAEVDECLTRLHLDDQDLVDVLTLDRLYLVVMPAEETGLVTVTFVALDPCEIVHVDG